MNRRLLPLSVTILLFVGMAVFGALRYDGWLYITVYVGLIVFFCYFYTAIQFNPTDVEDSLKKQNASIPGIRHGQRTAEYIDFVLSRLTLVGAW